MNQKQKIYWVCQVAGWLFYAIINLFFFGLSHKTSVKDIIYYSLWFITGILLTHLYRYFIGKYKIISIKILYQLVFVIFSSVSLSILFFFANFLLGSLVGLINANIDLVSLAEVIINTAIPFVLWSLIYFGFHYLQNYKKTEIQNLRWEASSKDIELNKLKSQLNPHFMFNSMNSIRALIDENPAKAKEAVTQLSNILRNTLLMNKNKEIVLEEELRIVKDYLELEKIRYEERLNFKFDVAPEALTKNVPPLIVQAQVENAIKHGISKLPKGGHVFVSAKIITDELIIEITNTGQLNNTKSETGFGLVNSQQRLELLYGDKAKIEIKNNPNDEVLVKIIIPTS